MNSGYDLVFKALGKAAFLAAHERRQKEAAKLTQADIADLDQETREMFYGTPLIEYCGIRALEFSMAQAKGNADVALLIMRSVYMAGAFDAAVAMDQLFQDDKDQSADPIVVERRQNAIIAAQRSIQSLARVVEQSSISVEERGLLQQGTSDALDKLQYELDHIHVQKDIATLSISDMEETAELLEAVKWILNDANYKAPEQIGDAGRRWIARLQTAVKPFMERAAAESQANSIDAQKGEGPNHG